MSQSRTSTWTKPLSVCLVLFLALASAQPVLAAPGLGLEDEVMDAAKTFGRILALIAIVMGALALLGGQEILGMLGFQVQRNVLMRVLVGVVLLGAAPDILEWMFDLI
jgi:uncharacterized membrane protein